MTYVAPSTRATGELITAAIWNQDVVDNVAYAFQPNSGVATVDEASDYSTTSGTFADIDGTDLSLTVECKSDQVLVHFDANVLVANSGANDTYVCFDVTVDGTRQGGDDGMYQAGEAGSQAEGDATLRAVSFTRLLTVTPGSRVFRLQWKVVVSAGTGTITLYAGAGTSRHDVHPQFWVRDAA